MKLNEVFSNVAAKTLAAVDIPNMGSNQHEINGAASIRTFFEITDTVRGRIKWLYFSDDGDPERGADGRFTFTDVRKKSTVRTGRSEWRLYYTGEFLERASPGDVLVLARPATNQLHEEPLTYGLLFEQDSNWLRAVQRLLGLDQSPTGTLRLIADTFLESDSFNLLGEQLLDALDPEDIVPPAQSDKELVALHFESGFPSTREMSAFARDHSFVDWREPDAALVFWIKREEQLFRALETIEVEARLPAITTVEDFLSYSLTVQNRRKSRMGHALENHLSELFTLHQLRFARQARTEGKRKPDFLFPGAGEYHDLDFPITRLRMLGAKSTLKERWRQVLDEAARVPMKHLCTIDPGASREQTAQIAETGIQLVLPEVIRAAYDDQIRAQMISLGDFIHEVKMLQIE